VRNRRGRCNRPHYDVPAIRETFALFALQEVETTYTVERGGSKKVKELLFMNYAPRRGLLDYI
jgi:hypothetical protein